MTNYLSAAFILARVGVISLLVDAPARGEGKNSEIKSIKIEAVRDYQAELRTAPATWQPSATGAIQLNLSPVFVGSIGRRCWHKDAPFKRPILLSLGRRSVRANTFCGSAGQQPSLIFRPWATGETRDSILGLECRKDYDEWLARVAADLERHRKDEAHARIACGPKCKLLDLLIKVLCESTIIPDHAWQKLVWLIHVPLDKHVLLGLRSCVRHFPDHASIGVIPENPTMNFITNHEAYTAFQKAIGVPSDEAGVPAIALDYLAWDGVH